MTTALTILARNVPNFGTSDARLHGRCADCDGEGGHRTTGRCDTCNGTGNGPTWEMALIGGEHRDSDTLDKANAAEIAARLLAVDPDMVAHDYMRANHWAVGWYEHLIVDPRNPAVMAVLAEARDDLDGYPILNEDRLSSMELDAHDDGACDQHCPFCQDDDQ